jgi:Smr domain
LSPIKTVNLKSDRPTVQQALTRLERELVAARQEGHSLLKIIHGYGSTGAGGDIRIAVQRQIRELSDGGVIRGCIFGEEWSKTNEEVWKLLQARPELKTDTDLGRRNAGITVVLL